VSFPGTGKTTLAQLDERFVDLDTGDIRDALRIGPRPTRTPDEKKLLLDTIVSAAIVHIKQGKVVLTNDPAIIPRIVDTYPVLMIIPEDVDSIVKRVRLGRGRSREFIEHFTRTASTQRDGWKEIASTYDPLDQRFTALEKDSVLWLATYYDDYRPWSSLKG
jgi:hypothetical protein